MCQTYKIFILVILLSLGQYSISSSCCSSACTEKQDPPKTAKEHLFDQMHKVVESLTSLHADLDYLSVQDPELLDAKIFRKGMLYYLKKDQKSRLRITFTTIQQDDEQPEVRPEHFLFDGVWLTKIDTALETIDLYQKAPADHPVGVFEFISHNFPMVGFTDPKKLEQDFKISVDAAPSDPNQPQHLSLEVREDSIYKDDYKQIEVWVNRHTWLPDRLTGVKVQGDLYELTWHNVQINKKIPEDVFTIETPANFRKNVHPLEK